MRTTNCDTPRATGPLSCIDAAASYKRSPLPPWVDLRLDSNEGSPPADDLLQQLTDLQAVELLSRYPQRDDLEERIAQRLGLSADRVLVTAGGDEAIDRICRAYLGPGSEIILPTPTFEMIERYAALAGGDIRRVAWTGSDFPTDRILSIACERTAVVAVVSPNNPTGAIATHDDIATLAAALPNAIIMVDLAYVEFADEDPTDLALEFPNCVVVRSMSKAWGLAGLRIGYALGDANVIGCLRAAGGPYAVAAPSVALASFALDNCEDKIDRRVAQIREERRRLADLLTRLGELPSPSQGNFVWCRFRRAEWIEQALRSLGIAVRRFANNADIADCLRITCPGNEATFARLCQALETILAPQSILFDMDGVLADVSDSYRTAIVRTAQTFGIALTLDEIAAAKAKGNANNDWLLTTRLLCDRGCRVSVDEVKTRFETIYQGTTADDGLWRRERPLVKREWLIDLSRRFSLGIVTGRPRADAERFLQTNNIRDCFATLVCMEDAPAKPSPDPVSLAMRQLNVTRSWLLGDTPDDIVAARAAGVLPIGVLAPGDKQSGACTLANAGAAAVLNQPTALENLLS